MEKSDKQMLKKLLAEYKAQLEREQFLLERYNTLYKEWEKQVENGCETKEMGLAVDMALDAYTSEKVNVNAIARLTLKYVMKIEKEDNTIE